MLKGESFYDKLPVEAPEYNAVYLYNPFWENVNNATRIDDEAMLVYCAKITRDKLSTLSSGSRAVIFNGYGGTLPHGFLLIHLERIRGMDLTVWEKK